MCAGAGTSVSSRFSVNSSNHWKPFCHPFFLVVLGFYLHQSPGASSSLRSVAGLEDVLDESCGSDVEDELVPEFADNPGTVTGTKFSVLHGTFFPFLERCGF